MDNQKDENGQEKNKRPASSGNKSKGTFSGFMKALFAPAPPPKKKRPAKVIRYIRPKKGNRIAVALVFIFAILSVSVLSSVGIIFLAREFLGIDKSAATYIVNIPENATTDDVIRIMTVDQEANRKEPIIKVDKMFRILAELQEKRNEEPIEYVSGNHNLRPNMGYQDILEELQSTYYIEKETVTITIREGMRIRSVAKMLEDEGVCAADKFIYYFNAGLDDYEFISNIPQPTANDLRFDRLEGYLFPDTYEFYKAPDGDVKVLEEQDYEIILRTIYENFEAKYDDELKARAAEVGMSMDKVVTLASIVQLEAANTEDMKNVASVFMNRLNDYEHFPALESNPTTEYSRYLKSLDDYSVTSKMLKAYDTYQTNGLPPGPICSPGLDAIKAVLWPNKTDYYYFCANIETKEPYYARTNEEHEANLIKSGIDIDDIDYDD